MKHRDKHGSWGSPKKRAPGPHVTVTEAQSLDEVLDILKDKQKHKTLAPPTLRQELGRTKLQRKNITLSMGGVKLTPIQIYQQNRSKTSVLGHEPWSRERVLEAMRSGNYKLTDLIKLTKVPANQLRAWLYDSKVWNIPEQGALDKFQSMVENMTELLRKRQAKSKAMQQRYRSGEYYETMEEARLKESIELYKQQIISAKQRLKERIEWIERWRE